MLAVPKQKFLERLDALPEMLRSVVFSTETGTLLSFICKNHHLDDERSNTVITYTAAVLLGFLHHTDLAKEIQENAKLDPKTAQAVAEEIELKVLARVKTEIERIYEPSLALEEVSIPAPLRVEAAPVPEARAPFSVPFSSAPLQPPVDKTSVPATPATRTPPTGPMMLHEEKPMSGEAKKGFKGFSIPFGLFRSKTAPETPKVAARVEIPGGATPSSISMPPPPPKKEEEVRTVHYNESRTPLSPFGQREEFINLETFEKFSPSAFFGKKNEDVPVAAAVTPTVNIPVMPPIIPPPVAPQPPALNHAEVPALSHAEVPVPAAPASEKSEETKVEPKPKETFLPRVTVSDTPEGGEPKLKGNVVDLR